MALSLCLLVFAILYESSALTMECDTPGECNIECIGEDSCKTAWIKCMPGYPCSVICNGKAACSDALISGNDASELSVQCSGIDACKSAALICSPNHKCSLNCAPNYKICDGISVHINSALSFQCFNQCPNNIRAQVFTAKPTTNPSLSPTKRPTNKPTSHSIITPPTSSPITRYPTLSPTIVPSMSPTNNPTTSPTDNPTDTPTINPTNSPTNIPTRTPTYTPSNHPTYAPTYHPITPRPIIHSSFHPTQTTNNPTAIPPIPLPIVPSIPLSVPTQIPTKRPTTIIPSIGAVTSSTAIPTSVPSTNHPTQSPSNMISTYNPSINPSVLPTSNPSISPTLKPTIPPTLNSTVQTVLDDNCSSIHISFPGVRSSPSELLTNIPIEHDSRISHAILTTLTFYYKLNSKATTYIVEIVTDIINTLIHDIMPYNCMDSDVLTIQYQNKYGKMTIDTSIFVCDEQQQLLKYILDTNTNDILCHIIYVIQQQIGVFIPNNAITLTSDAIMIYKDPTETTASSVITDINNNDPYYGKHGDNLQITLLVIAGTLAVTSIVVSVVILILSSRKLRERVQMQNSVSAVEMEIADHITRNVKPINGETLGTITDSLEPVGSSSHRTDGAPYASTVVIERINDVDNSNGSDIYTTNVTSTSDDNFRWMGHSADGDVLTHHLAFLDHLSPSNAYELSPKHAIV